MEPKVGLKFKKYHGVSNINNIDLCEIRGIVDDSIIVLRGKNKRNKKEFYLTMTKNEFNAMFLDGFIIKIPD